MNRRRRQHSPACTSSLKVMAPYLSATSQMAWMSATVPSMLFTDSNATSFGTPGGSVASSSSKCPTSLWR